MDDPDPGQNSLFVSYAHEDKNIVADLRKYFIPLEQRFGCKVLWDDSLIQSGDAWREKIEQAMTHARFAVLLMSVHFMCSDFIRINELPRLLQRRQRGELTVLPVLVGPVDMDLSGVADVQWVNPNSPLGKLNKFKRQEWYLELALRVKHDLLQLPAAANDAISGTAAPLALPPQDPLPTARDSAHDGADAITPAPEEQDDDDEANLLRPDTAQWAATVPQHMAVAEIENQLMRLKLHTRSKGFAVFDCDGYYVQFFYEAELDDQSVMVEVQSNAFLSGDRRLGKLQMRYLTDQLQFVQADPDENLLKCAEMRDEHDIAALARDCWTVLTEIYPSDEGAALSINAQCR